AAGYSFMEAVNNGLGLENAKQYTINPLLYIQKYVDSSLDNNNDLNSDIDEQLFTDISNDDEDYEAIQYLQEKGIIEGYEDGSFKSDNPINRAELMKMAFVGFEYNTSSYTTSYFPDVNTDDWFFPYVETGKQTGIIDGHPDGMFKPDDNITRAETLKVLLNTARIEITTFITSSYFSDVYLEFPKKQSQKSV
ncbi:MAG: S-layer homology domain-containing protein, partial [bacterium]|nr:S-layer homology domain-containing protein [bacterium]